MNNGKEEVEAGQEKIKFKLYLMSSESPKSREDASRENASVWRRIKIINFDSKYIL